VGVIPHQISTVKIKFDPNRLGHSMKKNIPFVSSLTTCTFKKVYWSFIIPILLWPAQEWENGTVLPSVGKMVVKLTYYYYY